MDGQRPCDHSPSGSKRISAPPGAFIHGLHGITHIIGAVVRSKPFAPTAAAENIYHGPTGPDKSSQPRSSPDFTSAAMRVKPFGSIPEYRRGASGLQPEVSRKCALNAGRFMQNFPLARNLNAPGPKKIWRQTIEESARPCCVYRLEDIQSAAID